MRTAITAILVLVVLIGLITAIYPSPKQEDQYRATGVVLAATIRNTVVLIRTPSGQGSGFLCTRGNATYVWTAAHIVSDVVATVTIGNQDGTIEHREIRELIPAVAIRIERQGYLDCQAQNYDAEYIACSTTEDLALLKLSASIQANLSFSRGSVFPAGTIVCHVGNFFGDNLPGAFSRGVISFCGFVSSPPAPGCDMLNLSVYPGSSGGPVCLQSGECIGLISKRFDNGLAGMIPVFQMRIFAERAGVAWAIDSEIPVAIPQEPYIENPK